MKSLFRAALAAIPLTTHAQSPGAIPVKNLLLNCSAEAEILSVSQEAYDPGLPPEFRFPGILPSGTFTAQVKVKNLSPGCEPLEKKYALQLDGFTMAAHFSVKQPQSLSQVKKVAQEIQGQTVALELKQYFGFEKNGYLPLFPFVHEEALFLQTSKEEQAAATGSIQLHPDLNWVYSLKPLESFSDVEKLFLAGKVAEILPTGGFGTFNPLLLKLEPNALELKKAYAQLILKIFHAIKSPYHNQVLDFNVGGNGTEYGAPLAKAFNKITQQGVLSEEEIEDAVFEIPTLLVTGSTWNGASSCLNVKEANLLHVLQELEQKLPILTGIEKSYWYWPLKTLMGEGTMGAQCHEQESTEAVKSLAASLLSKLNQ